MNADAMTTWDVLRDLGFEPIRAGLVSPALGFDFGGLQLSASCGMNRWFAQVITCSGVLSTRRTVAEIDFEIPLQIESREQCAAWIVWHLDESAGGAFAPAREVGWLLTGRQSRHLLPWVAEAAAHEAALKARPHCEVHRDWLRLALKTLRAALAGAEDEAAVAFAFDGAVLTILCAGRVVALPADGSAWPGSYSIPARQLRSLPTRLAGQSITVSLWKGRLAIGSKSYEGAVESEGAQVLARRQSEPA